MSTTTVRSGAADLSVMHWGSGPPVVALHPGVGDSRTWQWCAPDWAAAGFQVIAYDRRGFGRTTAPAEPHDDVADLLAVLDARTDGDDPAVLVGNSMGGLLALQAALAHPDRVRALVLIAPGASGQPTDAYDPTPGEQDIEARVEAADEAGDVVEVNRLEVHYWLDGPDQPEGRVAGPARDLAADMNSIALRSGDVGTAAEHPPVWDRLGTITVPTLIVVGALDESWALHTCQQLVEAIPGSRLVELADSAHLPSLDQPDELGRLVSDFLGSLPAS